jgi:hypothetical protein
MKFGAVSRGVLSERRNAKSAAAVPSRQILIRELTPTCRAQLSKSLSSDNGQGQNRTADTRIFSPLLYRLSYLA